MESLTQLEENIKQLLVKYRQLLDDYEDLRQKNIDLRQEVIQTHAELQSLKEKNRQLLIARSLGDTDETRENAKQQLTRIINQIDRAMEVLKK